MCSSDLVAVGPAVGPTVGAAVGWSVGGTDVGNADGAAVGLSVTGAPVGVRVGASEEGAEVGAAEGAAVGAHVEQWRWQFARITCRRRPQHQSARAVQRKREKSRMAVLQMPLRSARRWRRGEGKRGARGHNGAPPCV